MAQQDRRLFSFDPKRRPRCACPFCGWQTFWTLPGRGERIECERCHRWLHEAELVKPSRVP